MFVGVGVGIVSLNVSQEPVEGVAPEFTMAPVLRDDINSSEAYAAPGYLIQATNFSVTGTEPITYTYQWYRDGFGSIVGETNQTYRVNVTGLDANEGIFCDVTASNAFGSTSQVSNTTIGITDEPPWNYERPVIFNSATLEEYGSNEEVAVGVVLEVTEGLWGSIGSLTYTYQWVKNNFSIPGETNTTYTTTVLDLGAEISARVTATSSEVGSSNASSNTVIIV